MEKENKKDCVGDINNINISSSQIQRERKTTKSVQSHDAPNTFRISDMQKKILYIIGKIYSIEQEWVIKEKLVIPIFGAGAFIQPNNPTDAQHIIRTHGKIRTNVKNSLNRSLAKLHYNGFIKREDIEEHGGNPGFSYYQFDTLTKRDGFRYVFALTDNGSEKIKEIEEREKHEIL